MVSPSHFYYAPSNRFSLTTFNNVRSSSRTPDTHEPAAATSYISATKARRRRGATSNRMDLLHGTSSFNFPFDSSSHLPREHRPTENPYANLLADDQRTSEPPTGYQGCCFPPDIHDANQQDVHSSSLIAPRRINTDEYIASPLPDMDDILPEEEPQYMSEQNEIEQSLIECDEHIPFLVPEQDSSFYARKQDDIIGYIERSSRISLHSGNIIGIVNMTSSVRFTVKGYERVRVLTEWAGQDRSLPSYSTVYQKIFPFFLNECFAKTKRLSLPKKGDVVNPTMTMQPSGANCSSAATAEVIIIPPSEWALLDVITVPFVKNMFCHSETTNIFSFPNAIPPFQCVENALVVQNRSAVTDVTDGIFVKEAGMRKKAVPGDGIRVNFVSDMSKQWSDQLNKMGSYVVKEVVENVYGEREFLLQACISAVSCVGPEDEPLDSSNRAINSLQGEEQDIVRSLRTSIGDELGRSKDSRITSKGGESNTSQSEINNVVVPGDICVLLTSNQDREGQSMFCLYVCRFWKYEGEASYHIVWAERTAVRHSESGVISDEFRKMAAFPCKGTPELVRKATRTAIEGRKRDVSNYGKPQDGRSYLVYRALLYCDGFNSSNALKKQNSVGGVYLLPLGMSPDYRSSSSSVRVISLAPSGVATNEILLKIIPDIVHSTRSGVEGQATAGEKVVMFTDIFGFVADYPAAAEPIDAIGHTGNAPCTHCSIRKYEYQTHSKFGYTIDTHAMDSASLRSAERQKRCGEQGSMSGMLRSLE